MIYSCSDNSSGCISWRWTIHKRKSSMYTYNQSGVRLQQVITIQVNKLIQVITYRSLSCIKNAKNNFYHGVSSHVISLTSRRCFIVCFLKEKKEEIWLSPMTKAPTPTEMSKGQSDNTNNATKKTLFSTSGSRNILKGAATNEIFGRINSSTCFCGLVLYVCVVPC